MLITQKRLSKREQEIMAILFQNGPLSANDILAKAPAQVHNSTIRTQLRILEHKGMVTHDVQEGKFIFRAVADRPKVAEENLKALVETFFDGNAVAAIHSIGKLYGIAVS